MSSIVAGVAVAVSASTGASGFTFLISDIARYDGRKSYPHWLMQWASSTVMKLTFMCFSLMRNCSVDSLSGDTYNKVTPPSTALSRIFSISALCMLLYMAYAFTPLWRRCSTWSFIRAMSGVTTMHTPSMAMAGTWNVIDLPPPVGISPRVSFP